MTDFTIIEARPWHCGQMTRLMRLEHQKAIAMIGIDSHRELRARFDASAFRRAWLINGKLAALGGVTGSRLEPSGMVWLALSNETLHYPLEIVREARRQLDEIMILKRELITLILDGDESSRRFAVFLGFHAAQPECGKPAVSRFGRRDVLHFLQSDFVERIALGNSSAIAMKYQGRAA